MSLVNRCTRDQDVHAKKREIAAIFFGRFGEHAERVI